MQPAVNPQDAAFNTSGDAMCARNVICPDRACEAVASLVDGGHDFVLGIKRVQCAHWAEYFFCA